MIFDPLVLGPASTKLQWQKINSEGLNIQRVLRARVFGGWLVLLTENGANAMSFIPDPEHKWDGGSGCFE